MLGRAAVGAAGFASGWWAAPLSAATRDDRPNIVWIVGEDTGPQLGCYGDAQATTPHLDAMARDGARFTHCFSHSPVCGPARCGLITGQYPTTLGAHHMRSTLAKTPPMLTDALRRAGYYVTWGAKTANDSKQDFQFKPPEGAFNERIDWLTEMPPSPFFAYINLFTTHEGQVDRRTPDIPNELRHSPADTRLPPYWPDTPEIRQAVARYYDLVTDLDRRVGRILDSLDRRGLRDNTVVMFFGDHGWGFPRGKRWLYDTGLRTPLLVRWPRQIAPGQARDELVSFIDFAPTVLGLAGVDAPASAPGQSFLPKPATPREYVFAARDRMDEAYDRCRAVRDRRFKYIRNYHPEIPYGQPLRYRDRWAVSRAWRAAGRAGDLTGPQTWFTDATKPEEELYDTQSDPWETRNLATSPEHREVKRRLSQALTDWVERTGDLGGVPEQELVRRGILAETPG